MAAGSETDRLSAPYRLMKHSLLNWWSVYSPWHWCHHLGWKLISNHGTKTIFFKALALSVIQFITTKSNNTAIVKQQQLDFCLWKSSYSDSKQLLSFISSLSHDRTKELLPLQARTSDISKWDMAMILNCLSVQLIRRQLICDLMFAGSRIELIRLQFYDILGLES